MTTIPIGEASSRLSELIDQLQPGEEIGLTCGSDTVARLVKNSILQSWDISSKSMQIHSRTVELSHHTFPAKAFRSSVDRMFNNVQFFFPAVRVFSTTVICFLRVSSRRMRSSVQPSL